MSQNLLWGFTQRKHPSFYTIYGYALCNLTIVFQLPSLFHFPSCEMIFLGLHKWHLVFLIPTEKAATKVTFHCINRVLQLVTLLIHNIAVGSFNRLFTRSFNASTQNQSDLQIHVHSIHDSLKYV